MHRPVLRALLVAGVVVALMRAIVSAVEWWNGKPLSAWDIFWIALLPALAWAWYRHASVLAPDKGRCLVPDERSCE